MKRSLPRTAFPSLYPIRSHPPRAPLSVAQTDALGKVAAAAVSMGYARYGRRALRILAYAIDFADGDASRDRAIHWAMLAGDRFLADVFLAMKNQTYLAPDYVAFGEALWTLCLLGNRWAEALRPHDNWSLIPTALPPNRRVVLRITHAILSPTMDHGCELNVRATLTPAFCNMIPAF